MKKKELSALPALRATEKMMQMARADKLIKRQQRYGGWVEGYERGFYLRSQVYGRILKVAIYLTEYMRMGVRDAAFEVYVDKEHSRFLTYDRLGDRWRTAKVDCLPWPRYVYSSTGHYIHPHGAKTIQQYFGGAHGGYMGLLEYQEEVREDSLRRRYRRETAPWDADLAQIPPLPKDWERWYRKVGIPENYIFYQYSRKGAKTGYCTYCEREVPIQDPRHNGQGVCPRCRRPITFKSEGKAGTVRTEDTYLHLLQRCADGFVLRVFLGDRVYSTADHRKETASFRELRRVIYDRDTLQSRVYCWEDYKHRETRWIPQERVHNSSYNKSYWRGSWEGLVYGRTIPSLARQELARTGLPELIRLVGKLDPEQYLAMLHERPILEQLAKAGLGGLAIDCMYKNRDWYDISMVPGAGLAKSLGIDAQEMSRLRRCQGGREFLSWLRYEKETGKGIPDHTIAWFCSCGVEPRDLRDLPHQMSPLQVSNYLRRQMRELHMPCRQVLTTWADHLSMAARLKLDLNNVAVYRVRRLKQRHDELLGLFDHDASLAIRAGQVLQKYPHIEDILQRIKPKYEFADEAYTVLVPERIEEIMIEGRLLGHCVANIDRYWDRIERRESYVLFLRRTADMDRPYYTLEVEPNGTIRQKRTQGDNQEADIEEVSAFLRKWQKAVAKRLDQEDLELARASRVLRIQEFEELRESQVTVRTGKLAGAPLLEVLQQDLMEAS